MRRNPLIKGTNPHLPVPPGPKGLPIIGVLDIPSKMPWLVYKEWSKKYGDMMFFKSFNSSFLILTSASRIKDLMEQRSAKYSSQPRMVMVMELMGWEHNFAFMPYGSLWRRHRRAFHDQFHAGVVDKYASIQLRGMRGFLHNLFIAPEQLHSHICFIFGATILDIVYGIRVTDWNDEYLMKTEEAVIAFIEAANPGSFLVDVIPILKYVPSWFPGAGFKRFAESQREAVAFTRIKPFEHVKKSMENGTVIPSVVATMLQALPDDDKRAEEEAIIQQMASIAYGESSSAFWTFFFAMAMYPEVQKKAQAELDAIVGNDHLPSFEDRPSLHYVNALVREATRWVPVVPLGVPHVSTEDDVYDGYFIQKGTLVIGNIWSRFLKDGKFELTDVLDPHSVVFGSGRRICPGRFLGDNLLFITAAAVLSQFDILPPLDKDGHPVKLNFEVTDGFIV
ncbi:hypothetical protein AMATHDRAFT_77844 [Amanita thiersii Skay4041]|uniref:Cytochrome P450 n=1 Tax=Amanita thiersii Skay4041 TaxID=703135 RepID=A0A2A9NEF4_9AGAR|nr:hypothetical protein AMATHDRAFT_77844 [Amanita thiersii Skay4041]